MAVFDYFVDNGADNSCVSNVFNTFLTLSDNLLCVSR